jgi:hypothetical protein
LLLTLPDGEIARAASRDILLVVLPDLAGLLVSLV